MSADNRLRIHNLWAQSRLSNTKLPSKLHTHEAFLFLAQSISTTYLSFVPVLSVNAFGKSHNKWLCQQSQHFRKTLIIFSHSTRAKHGQITPKNFRFLHLNRPIETFLDPHSRFIQDPGCKPVSPLSLWPVQKSASIPSRPIGFTPRTYLWSPRLVTAKNKARNIHSFRLKAAISLSPVQPNETKVGFTEGVDRLRTLSIVRLVPS